MNSKNCYVYGPRVKRLQLGQTKELEQIYNYITEGSILRTRTDWYEEGAKSMQKYFLNLEKRS